MVDLKQSANVGGLDLDDALDEMLGPSQPRETPVSNNTGNVSAALERLREKKSRLAMLRDRSKQWQDKYSEPRSPEVNPSRTGTDEAGAIPTVSVSGHNEKNELPTPLDHSSALTTRQEVNGSVPAVEKKPLITTTTVKREDDRRRKRLELKEKLRQKEAQLAKLRSQTMLRKRPLENQEAGTDSDQSRLSESASTSSSEGPQSASERPSVSSSYDRQKHIEHLKRVKMMTAKKRQDLARYRSKFARQAAAEAY